MKNTKNTNDICFGKTQITMSLRNLIHGIVTLKIRERYDDMVYHNSGLDNPEGIKNKRFRTNQYYFIYSYVKELFNDLKYLFDIKFSVEDPSQYLIDIVTELDNEYAEKFIKYEKTT